MKAFHLKALCCCLGIVAWLGCAQASTPADRILKIRLVDPFALDLRPDRWPEESVPLDPSSPVRAQAALGETTTIAVLAFSGPAVPTTVTLEVRPISGQPALQGCVLDLFLLKGLPRSNRYLHAMIGPELAADLARCYPDVLIQNEQAFDAQTPQIGPGRLLSLSFDKAVTFKLGPGQVRYVLARASVSLDCRPGPFRLLIDTLTDPPGPTALVPVEIQVLPFSLPAHGRVLSVANDLGDPDTPHFETVLRDLADHGMTATRLRGATSKQVKKQILPLLESLGYTHLIQADPPRDAEEASARLGPIFQYFYGVDEPQPKGRAGSASWARMADHVRLSAKIHAMGGRVTTSIPFDLASELADPASRLYAELSRLGYHGSPQPLDWANYGLGLQRLGRQQRPQDLGGSRGDSRPGAGSRSEPERSSLSNSATPQSQKTLLDEDGEDGRGLFAYMALLRREYSDGVTIDGRRPRSKRDLLETYYFPLGYMKSPFFARLLFGFFLFNSHLDGASAWTLYRPKGNPFTDDDGPDPVIAYPVQGGMIATYWWEAVREGVNDLRYCKLAEDLILAIERSAPESGRSLRARLVSLLAPYGDLLVDGQRIDRVLQAGSLRRTRAELVSFIEELRRTAEAGRGPKTESRGQ